jgi:hypothetical protein
MLRDPSVTGTDAHIPSFMRGAPGHIVASRAGRRFGDEGASYHEFNQLMLKQAAAAGETTVEAFLVADHAAVRRYGIGGVVKPFPFPLAPHLKSGLLLRADSLEALAEAAGIDPLGLSATVAAFNHHAQAGRDADFHRGESPFRPAGKRVSLGQIRTAPFYAIRITSGDIVTMAVVSCDACARVLGPDGTPIEGLYVAGNDMASPFGGAYPGPGGTVGPALTFGYIAALHISGQIPAADS